MRRLAVGLVVLAVLGAAVFWFLTIPHTIDAATLGSRNVDLGNGRTMFYAGGCVECHATPGQDNREQLGGGLALKTPFGIFHAPNISSDRRYGIGAWRELDFVTAMVKGTSPTGQHYYPAFPYTSYQRMDVGDLRDLFAYLKTLPAVQAASREHELRFPFNVRRGLGLWKLLYLDGEPFRPHPGRPASWNRGAYLVTGPAHCGECHTPRNLFGGPIKSLSFAGGASPEGEGWIPNITQKPLKDWSENDFIELLDTGRTENGESVSGPMAAVVKNTSALSREDRAAMAAYLKSLPPREGPSPPDQK
jgi:mono/diheme cytochrome c family protein